MWWHATYSRHGWVGGSVCVRMFKLPLFFYCPHEVALCAYVCVCACVCVCVHVYVCVPCIPYIGVFGYVLSLTC